MTFRPKAVIYVIAAFPAPASFDRQAGGVITLEGICTKLFSYNLYPAGVFPPARKKGISNGVLLTLGEQERDSPCIARPV